MIDAFLPWLLEELANAGSSLFDLSKRVSLVYLISALLFASSLFFYRYGKAGLSRVKVYFSWRIWTHASARTDYALWLLNRLLLAFMIPKALAQSVWISWLFFFWQEQGLSSLAIGFPDILVVAFFTLCYFLTDDFSRFFVHWCMHKNAFLWAFHQVHHSATVLTPFTVFRTHPIEGLLFFLRSLFVQSLVISVFLVLFPNQISLMQVFGILITTFFFNVLGANLRHSGVALSYGERIEKWLISPAQHQIHHSNAKCHYDRNFGVALAIWDRLFGSWHQGKDNQEITFGTNQPIDKTGFLGQWLIPFKDISQLLTKALKKGASCVDPDLFASKKKARKGE
ncbi:sterol desaturase family protein [Marinomonas sp. 5E14-1]|uniref:sterol desaturase family protein n=1 Tax=Marinomonas sp. 5E14-1 TaxID=3153922 RepID=UPI0032675666